MFPKIYYDVVEIYRWHRLEESQQRLENVDRTHLVLASGKLVPQKAQHVASAPYGLGVLLPPPPSPLQRYDLPNFSKFSVHLLVLKS